MKTWLVLILYIISALFLCEVPVSSQDEKTFPQLGVVYSNPENSRIFRVGVKRSRVQGIEGEIRKQLIDNCIISNSLDPSAPRPLGPFNGNLMNNPG